MISEDIIARIGIAFLGLCGFLVARHIYKEKRADRPLICPMHFDCNAVVSFRCPDCGQSWPRDGGNK
jgi:hypothetical protein